MIRFSVRVVLHGAPESAYDRLHQEMLSELFFRMIEGDSGAWYHLPPAEYDYASVYESAVDVRIKVKRIAARTGYSNAVFVTEAGDRAWSGLERVEILGAGARALLGLAPLPLAFTR